jgi:hypothetical protein
MAVVVVTTLFYPGRRVTLFGLFAVPLWLLTATYVLMELSGILHITAHANPGSAFLPLLGGAMTGLAFKSLDLRLFSPRTPEGISVLGPGLFTRAARQWGRQPREVPLDDRISPPAPRTAIDPRLANRVDEILRKISKEGIDSLTSEERAALDEASEYYRKS